MYNKLNLDGDWDVKYHGSIVYAKNKVLDNTRKSINTEDGFDKIYETAGDIIGIKFTNYHIIIFSIENTFHKIEVFDFKTNTATTIIKSIYLHFNLDNPIIAIAYYNYKEELITNWIDGIATSSNAIRSLNINNIPFELDVNKELVNPSDITLLNIYPDVLIPKITYNSVDDSGSLPAAGYQIFIGYIYDDFDETFWLNNSNTLTIYKKSFNLNSDTITGCKSGLQTNKAINLNINNIPSNVYKLKVGVLQIKNGIKSAFRLDYQVTNTNTTIIIDDLNSFYQISLEDLTITPVIYDKAYAITEFANRAIYGNLINAPMPDLQKYINNGTVKWISTKKAYYKHHTGSWKDHGYKDNNYIFNDKTFLPFEVYALYIRVFHKNGSIIGDYHLPGRDVLPLSYNYSITGCANCDDRAEFTTVNGTNSININTNPDFNEDYHINKPTSGTNNKMFHTRDTSRNDGTMSFWENDSETYPDNPMYDIWAVNGSGIGYNTGITLRKHKVRHHRFPSQSFLFNNGKIPTDNNSKPILGIKVENINFPDDIAVNIQGFKIMYAIRNKLNSTVKDDSIVHSVDKYGENTKLTLQHYNYTPATSSNKYIELKPYNSILNNNIIDFNYMKPNYELTKTVINMGLVDSTVDSFPDDNIFYQIRKYLVELTTSTIQAISNANATFELNNLYHIPKHTDLANISNLYNDDMVVATANVWRGDNFYYVVTLLNNIRNIYQKFYKQTLAAASDIYYLNETNIIGYGDSFIGLYGYRTSSAFIDASNRMFDQRTLFTLPVYSRSNIELRYDDENTVFYPNLDDGIYDIDEFLLLTYAEYAPRLQNTDFDKLNDIIIGLIDNPDLNFINKFPYRYIISNSNASENLRNNWNVIPYNSYRDTDITKGYIASLNANSNTLFIQKRDSLYVINIADQLIKSDTSVINVNSQDLFNAKLIEIVPSDVNGYIGTKERFGNVVTKYGYCVLDTDKGNVFIVMGTKAKIISIGVTMFLRSFIPHFKNSNINPIHGSGLVLGYNDIDDILIMSFSTTGCQDETNECDDPSMTKAISFTLSYNFGEQGWIGFHTYLPELIQYNRHNLYSIKYNIIYQHNSLTKMCTYYRNKHDNNYIIHDDIVDYFFNAYLNKTSDLIGMAFVKLYNGFTINANIIDINNNYIYDRQADTLAAYTDTQCTGDVIVKKQNWFKNDGFRILNGRGYFNKLIDIVTDDTIKFMSKFQFILSNLNRKNFFEKSNFISKFIVLRQTHINSTKQVAEKLSINNVTVDFNKDNLNDLN